MCYSLEGVAVNEFIQIMRLPLLLIFLFVAVASSLEAQAVYKGPELFAFRPAPHAKEYKISRFGPVGISMTLVQPAFQIRVDDVEKGSPAEGKLKKGQVITTINGETLHSIDPRIQLGNMITKAEATDGVLEFTLKSGSKTTVRIPVMGSYSPTWPLNCPKSEKIIKNFADHIIKESSKPKKEAQVGFCEMGMLFLLSTGDDQYLPIVKRWIHKYAVKDKPMNYAWFWGYRGIMLCEYYLRTGDKAILPHIQESVNNAVQYECFGAWGGRGLMARTNYGGGGGHLNAGSTLACGFLMLAKECGVKVPDETLNRVLAHFYRYAGRGVVPYGNGLPEKGFADNGKNGKLAFAMAAAASLSGSDDSIYARARDTAALSSFYNVSYMLLGHTGGGIGEIWRSAAMGLLYEKMPNHYRDFMNQRCWHYELSRRHDGSMAIVNGGGRYDNIEWGAGYALTYTIPRKTLRITGAPPTKYSNRYKLPENPWGNKADMDFVAKLPPMMPDGSRIDISGETIETSAAAAIQRQLKSPNLDVDTVRYYMHHPQFMVRTSAAQQIRRFEPVLMTEFLQSKDARVRCAALDGMLLSNALEKLITYENLEIIVQMVSDPEESWYVKHYAMEVMKKMPPKAVVPHVDKIIPYLQHEEWWLQKAALNALVPVMAHPACYEKVIPAIGECLKSNQLHNVTWDLRSGRNRAMDSLVKSSPKTRQLALRVFKGTFLGYEPLKGEHPHNMEKVNGPNRQSLAEMLVKLPGGYDALYQSLGNKVGGYGYLFKRATASELSPELKQALKSK